jgi:ATP-dependent DNA ligase
MMSTRFPLSLGWADSDRLTPCGAGCRTVRWSRGLMMPADCRLYAWAMPIPEPMLSTRVALWPVNGDWVMEPKWDGFRLLVAIDAEGRVRAWSRRGASLGDRVGSLLEPLAGSPGGTVFDAELVALGAREGRVVQDFAAVCRATLQGDVEAAKALQLVAFDLLELAGDDLRSLAWVKRTGLLREVFPVGDRLRLVQSQPASRAVHDELVALGFEGSVLKRPGSTYRPGRQSTWRKYKTTHRVAATLRAVRPGRHGDTYAICDLGGRRVTTLGSPRLAALIGHQVELAYSRVDADGSLREVRISAIDARHAAIAPRR